MNNFTIIEEIDIVKSHGLKAIILDYVACLKQGKQYNFTKPDIHDLTETRIRLTIHHIK